MDGVEDGVVGRESYSFLAQSMNEWATFPNPGVQDQEAQFLMIKPHLSISTLS